MQEASVRFLGWQYPLEGKGFPLQYSGLKNSMDCVVHGVTKSRKQLSYFHSLPHVYTNNIGFSGSSAGKESTCHARDPNLIPGSGRSAGEGIGYPLQYSWTSQVTQLVKNLPAVWETEAWSLGWEDPWRRERLPTPVFWPGEFHGMYGCMGCKDSDMTEWLSLSLHFFTNNISLTRSRRHHI